MRPLHKKLIDQFQMMRASLYHVSAACRLLPLLLRPGRHSLHTGSKRRERGALAFCAGRKAEPLIHSLPKEAAGFQGQRTFSQGTAA